MIRLGSDKNDKNLSELHAATSTPELVHVPINEYLHLKEDDEKLDVEQREPRQSLRPPDPPR